MNKYIHYLALLFFINAVFATSTITERKAYYKIHAESVEELRQQMNTIGPIDNDRHVDSKTIVDVTWHYNWHYDDETQNPCFITNIKVNTDVTYIFPEWVNMDDYELESQSHWKKFLTNLATHELKHADNGKQAGTDIERAMTNIKSMPNCKALRAAVDKITKDILAQHRDWDIKYDTDTDHGRTQGAML